jgi:hypothetical protein
LSSSLFCSLKSNKWRVGSISVDLLNQ